MITGQATCQLQDGVDGLLHALMGRYKVQHAEGLILEYIYGK